MPITHNIVFTRTQTEYRAVRSKEGGADEQEEQEEDSSDKTNYK